MTLMGKMEKNLIYQIVYRVVTVLTPFITTPILSRNLGAEKLGTYSATMAYTNYFMLFAMLGIEIYGNRTIASMNTKEERQKKFWEIYSIQFVTSVMSLGIFVFSILRSERIDILLLQGIWLVSCIFDINWFFWGCEKFKVTVIKNLIIKTITVTGIIILIKEPKDLLLYTVLMSGSSLICQMILWVNLFHTISYERPLLQNIKVHIRPIIKLFIPVLAVSVYHIMDKSMIDFWGNEVQLGYYVLADKLINIPLGVISAVSAVMLPRVANLLSQNSNDVRERIGDAVEIVFWFIGGIAFGIGSIARIFIPLFYGEGYEECILLVYLFIFVLISKALNEVIRVQFLIPTCRDKIYINSVFIGAIVNAISNYLLIPRYEALGAVIGTFLAESAVLIAEIVSTRKSMDFLKIFFANIRYIEGGLLMLISLGFLEYCLSLKGWSGVIIMIIAGGIFYVCFCAFFVWRKKRTFLSGKTKTLIDEISNRIIRKI